MSPLIGAITRQYGNIIFESGYAIVKDTLKTRVKISINNEEILLLNTHLWRKFADFLKGCHTDWYIPESNTLELFFARELPNNDWEFVCLLDGAEKKINITIHDWFNMISNHYNTTSDVELFVFLFSVVVVVTVPQNFVFEILRHIHPHVFLLIVQVLQDFIRNAATRKTDLSILYPHLQGSAKGCVRVSTRVRVLKHTMHNSSMN